MHKEMQIIAFNFKENIYLVILVTVNIKNSNSASVIVCSEQLIKNHPVCSNITGWFPHPLCLLFLVPWHFQYSRPIGDISKTK